MDDEGLAEGLLNQGVDLVHPLASVALATAVTLHLGGVFARGESPCCAPWPVISCGRRIDLAVGPVNAAVMSSGRWAGGRSPGSGNQARKHEEKRWEGRALSCVGHNEGLYVFAPKWSSPSHLTSPHHAIPIRNDAYDAQSPIFSPGVSVGGYLFLTWLLMCPVRKPCHGPSWQERKRRLDSSCPDLFVLMMNLQPHP